MGYEVQSIDIAGQTEVEILLFEQAQELESVIVTTFGIEREKKTAFRALIRMI